MRELPGQGLTQQIVAYWVDETVAGISAPPTVIHQSIIHSDPLLGRIAQEGRQGKMFAGLTRDIEGFLRTDFENQKIKSFLSIPIFANGNAWGSVAINDCVHERIWTDDDKAAMEIVALALGDAIERGQSDAHVSEVIRAALLQASLDAVIVIDESGKIIEFNPAAEKMYGFRQDRRHRQGPAPYDHSGILPQGLHQWRRVHDRARRADAWPPHGDCYPERRRRDLSDRAHGQ